VGDEPRQRESLLPARLERPLDECEHPALIEMAIAEIRVGPIAQLELAALLRRHRADPGRLEPAHVIVAQRWIHDMESALAALKSFLDEREQSAVFLIRTAEEGADVT